MFYVNVKLEGNQEYSPETRGQESALTPKFSEI